MLLRGECGFVTLKYVNSNSNSNARKDMSEVNESLKAKNTLVRIAFNPI